MKILDIIIVKLSNLKKKINEYFNGHTPKGDYCTQEDLDRIKIEELKKLNDEACKNNPFEKLSLIKIDKNFVSKKKKWQKLELI